MPAMDRPSVYFAHLLDSIVVEDGGEVYDNDTLVCLNCGDVLCTLDPGDTMRVLLNTALAHECERGT